MTDQGKSDGWNSYSSTALTANLTSRGQSVISTMERHTDDFHSLAFDHFHDWNHGTSTHLCIITRCSSPFLEIIPAYAPLDTIHPENSHTQFSLPLHTRFCNIMDLRDVIGTEVVSYLSLCQVITETRKVLENSLKLSSIWLSNEKLSIFIAITFVSAIVFQKKKKEVPA